MKEILDWLSSNHIATIALIVFLGAVIFSVLFVFIIAFLQGREISFWPPKIGSRPSKSQLEGDLNKPVSSSLPAKLSRRSNSGSQTLAIPNSENRNFKVPSSFEIDSEIEQTSISVNQELFNPPQSEPIVNSDFAKIHLRDIKVLEIVANTPNSLIEKCLVEGRYFVLKRTKRELCDEQTLIELVNYSMESKSVVIAKPIALWITEQYIWELYPYYSGISLSKIIQCNKYSFQGDLLGDLHNGVFRALNELHKANILHRDINPTNFLMTSNGSLVLLDATFSAKRDAQSVPVGNKFYTPPEQLLGKATVQSDWYSVAATLYFMANGEAPPINNLKKLSAGLRRVDVGAFSSHFYGSGSHILQLMLQKDASQRPNNLYHILMNPHTIPMGCFYDVLGVLDLEQFGYLVTQTYDYHVFDREQLINFLSDAIQNNALNTNELLNDVNSFLAGGNPWLRS